jgi:hypothetical protein
MKRRIIVFVMILLLTDGFVMADVSRIRNGSFEMDGQIADITVKNPRHWQYVDVPVSQFTGYLDHFWATDANWSLALSTQAYATFQQGDSANVAQCVFFGDVNRIAFDLELSTEYPQLVDWDSSLFSVILTIDGNIVWDSYDEDLSQNGEYPIEVNDINVSPGLHLLGVGIITNTTAAEPYYYYYVAQWDSIRFDTGAVDINYPPVDFNYDCIVDYYDLQTIANGWLLPTGKDFTGDGTENFSDFEVFADYWRKGCTTIPVEPNFVDPPEADFNNDGVIDYYDILIFSQDWLGGCSICVRSDLNNDNFVDFVDFALFAEQWQQ